MDGLDVITIVNNIKVPLSLMVKIKARCVDSGSGDCTVHTGSACTV